MVRVICGVLALIFGVVAVGGRRHRPGRSEARVEKPLGAVTGGLWGVVIFSSLVAFLLEVAAPGWVYEGPLTVAFPGDTILQVVGLAIGFAGGWLVLAAARTLGRQVRIQIMVAKDHDLITSGPYAWVRHPMYTAMILINAGAALLLLNAAMATIAVVTYAIALRRALLEEQVLASPEGFGDKYRAYMHGTGRFLPRPGRGRPATDSRGNLPKQ